MCVSVSVSGWRRKQVERCGMECESPRSLTMTMWCHRVEVMRWARLMWWQDFDFRPKYVEKRNIYCYPTYLWTSDSKRDGTREEKNREKLPSPVPSRLTTSPFIPSQCLALQIDTGSSVTSRLRLITGFDLGCHHHEGLLNIGWVLGWGLDKLNAEGVSKFLSQQIISYNIILSIVKCEEIEIINGQY